MQLRLKGIFLAASLQLALASTAGAFVLLGPPETWQTTDLGYRDWVSPSVELGEPKNLTEEYRLNVRNITYGFTPGFLTWFGDKGVEEIERAIEKIAEIDSFLDLDINDYPLETIRYNATAAQLQLLDLHSWALAAISKNYVGLGNPMFWSYGISSRVQISTDPLLIAYNVLQRNYDPDTLLPSSYVNGNLYTFTEILEDATGALPPTVTAVDPLASRIGPMTSFDFNNNEPGWYSTGLTRDDVGGLRYLYRRDNINVENVQGDHSRSEFGEGLFPVFDGSVGGSSPWIPVVPVVTNQVATTATNFVNAALRPGLNRLTFSRLEFDSSLGAFAPIANVMRDTYITNGAPRQQNLVRTNTRPDLLFDVSSDPNITISYEFVQNTGPNASTAQSIGSNGPLLTFGYTEGGGLGTFRFVNTGTNLFATSFDVGGPGVATPVMTVAFGKLTPGVATSNPGASEASGFPLSVWASFDGSTNPPVVYPQGFEFDRNEFLGAGSDNDPTAGAWIPVPAAPTAQAGQNAGGNAGANTTP